MSIDAEILDRHLPTYLLPSEKAQLFEELKKFPSTGNYFTCEIPYEGIMQGDCYSDLFHYTESGIKKNCKAVVFSNTCDLSVDNHRTTPMRVIFSPLIELNKYKNVLTDRGVSERRIADQFEAIRTQKITNIVYFPNFGTMPELIARLDHVYSLPASYFRTPDNRILRLNTFGFYLFVIKLSIHFTRFQEGLDGGNPREQNN